MTRHVELWFPEDRKEAVKFALGYLLLIFKYYKLDDHPDRKKAMDLLDAYLKGQVDDKTLNDEYERYEEIFKDIDFWHDRHREEFTNAQFGQALCDLYEADDDNLIDGLQNALLYLDARGINTSDEIELRRKYFDRK